MSTRDNTAGIPGHGANWDRDWQASLVRFLDSLTELAKLGAEALKKELAEKA